MYNKPCWEKYLDVLMQIKSVNKDLIIKNNNNIENDKMYIKK